MQIPIKITNSDDLLSEKYLEAMNSPKSILKSFYQINILRIFIICTLLINISLGVYSQDLNPRQLSVIQQIEQKVFGIKFLDDTELHRIQRLEQHTYGESPTNKTIAQRIYTLQKEYKVRAKSSDIVAIAQDKNIVLEDKVKAPVSANTQTKPVETQSFSKPARKLVEKINLQENIYELQDEFFLVLNEERRLRGLKKLVLSEKLNTMANSHASYLVQTKQFSHFGYQGANPEQRYRQIQGTGQVSELIDGFYADRDQETFEVNKIEANRELAHHLMDALLQNTDKEKLLFNKLDNNLGLSFVLAPDKSQLVAVLEFEKDYIKLKQLPLETKYPTVSISGHIKGTRKFAWIGISRETQVYIPEYESEVSAFIPPLDEVLYLDKKEGRLKKGLQLGALIAGTVAAPFTYGASMVFADLLNRQISETYHMEDIKVYGGINADSNGFFRGNIKLGESGKGLYYITVWGFEPKNVKTENKKPKPVLLSRQAVLYN